MKHQPVVATLLFGVLVALALWLFDGRNGQSPFSSRDQPSSDSKQQDPLAPAKVPTVVAPPPRPEDFDDPTEQQAARQRLQMVQQQLRERDITDQNVLAAMARVPRHRFVPQSHRALAYRDGPMPIGHGQTISQPYVVALMTQLVRPQRTHRALDVGTGSGYQAAVLAELVRNVYSIEIVKPLADEARARLKSLGYKNVGVRHGDGYNGWPEKAPFDIIVVAAAPDHIPQSLIKQLAPGGRLVIPVGTLFQQLIVVEKRRDGSVHKRRIAPVAFVPLTRDAASKD